MSQVPRSMAPPAPRHAIPPTEIVVSPSDRVLVIAPHPDDESLGTGGLIRTCCAAAATVHVLFLTDGENNPWAQRATELRLRIGPAERSRFGARRRSEAIAALKMLGFPAASAKFVGFPDQGLTNLLRRAPETVVGAIAHELEMRRPTLVAAPAMADLHPDHSASAVLVELALRHSVGQPRQRLAYLIHNPELRRTRIETFRLSLSTDAQARKRAAILLHRTQRRLRGAWLRSFAAPFEPFIDGAGAPPEGLHPIGDLHRTEETIELPVVIRPRLRAFGPPSVLLLSCSPGTSTISLEARLGRAGPVSIGSPRANRAVGEATWRGGPRQGTLILPSSLIPPSAALFAKLEHPFGFFDAAGWRPVEFVSART